LTRYVHDPSEGDKVQTDLLGGKGANLAKLTKLGLPVTPGFRITTEACLGPEPGGLWIQGHHRAAAALCVRLV
jgi:pyruvate, orthophosphate dikinase